MTTFTIEITNDSHLAGIEAAMSAYNNSLPATITVDGEDIPNPELFSSSEQYVQFVMSKAAESYANQYNTLTS